MLPKALGPLDVDASRRAIFIHIYRLTCRLVVLFVALTKGGSFG